MREIKFRAWDDEYKKWCKYVNEMTVKWLNPEREFLKIMQYTGLKDKNGVEIYEGDIVNLKDWYPAIFSDNAEDAQRIVMFKNGCFAICGINDQEVYSFFDMVVLELCEVIGNIYQNPELLEKIKC